MPRRPSARPGRCDRRPAAGPPGGPAARRSARASAARSDRATSATAGPRRRVPTSCQPSRRRAGWSRDVEAVAGVVGHVDPADEGDLAVDDHRLLVVAVERVLARIGLAADPRVRGSGSGRPRAPPCGSGGRPAPARPPTPAPGRRPARPPRPAARRAPPGRSPRIELEVRRDVPPGHMDVVAGVLDRLGAIAGNASRAVDQNLERAALAGRRDRPTAQSPVVRAARARGASRGGGGATRCLARTAASIAVAHDRVEPWSSAEPSEPGIPLMLTRFRLAVNESPLTLRSPAISGSGTAVTSGSCSRSISCSRTSHGASAAPAKASSAPITRIVFRPLRNPWRVASSTSARAPCGTAWSAASSRPPEAASISCAGMIAGGRRRARRRARRSCPRRGRGRSLPRRRRRPRSRPGGTCR